MRILYVEDNPANISLLQRIARMGGHDVVSYNDGEVALSNFERDKPDLILMDLQLAGALNGLDVVRKLRADGVTTPIVAVTAYAMVGDKERCIEAGCDGYLAKPLPVADLVETVQKYEQALKSKEAAADSTETFAAVEAKTDTLVITRRQEQPAEATEAERSKVIRGATPLPDLAKKAAARKAAKEKKESAAKPAPKPEPANNAETSVGQVKAEPEVQQVEKTAAAPAKNGDSSAPGQADVKPASSNLEETVKIAVARVPVENGKKE